MPFGLLLDGLFSSLNSPLWRSLGQEKKRSLIFKKEFEIELTASVRKLARHGERGKTTRQTEGEVGRQHQEINRPGVRKVPECSGEQGKMEKTGCKIICGAPTILSVNGLMMMMMMFGNKIKAYKRLNRTLLNRTIKQDKMHIFEESPPFQATNIALEKMKALIYAD